MMVYGFDFNIKKKAVLMIAFMSPFSSKIKARATILPVSSPRTSLV